MMYVHKRYFESGLSNITVVVCFFILSCSGTGKVHSEWHDLFNGQDLAGWKRLNGSAEFTVEDRLIIGTTKGNTENTFLATEESYSDFVLELEFLVDSLINSGIQIRSNSSDYQNGRVFGYQVEIDPSERGWSGGIYDEARRGWLYPVSLNPEVENSFNRGGWNKLYIEAVGPVIKTWLNDVPITHLIDDLTDRGFIALQIHSINRPELIGRKIKWRNIRIKTTNIKPKPGEWPHVVNNIPNYLSEAEVSLGWRTLFDGQSAEKWRGAHMDSFPEHGWKVDNGELSVIESGGGESEFGGDIVTHEEFSSFEFQVDFKITGGANSGIKYFVTEGYNQHSGSAIGLEYQILDDENHPDSRQGRDGNRTLGSLYDLIPAYKEPRITRKVGEWNHARIVVKPDNHVEHWLNGYKVLEYERGSEEFNELVKMSKYVGWENFGLAESGHILLQDHGNEVSFRSIKVRNLD